MSVAFVGDKAIAGMNEKFLAHKGPTDVIAFRLEDDVPELGDRTVGEIAVSTDTAAREAARRGVPERDELALYVVHGLLHLAGYDDADRAQQERMYAREKGVLTQAGFPYVR